MVKKNTICDHIRSTKNSDMKDYEKPIRTDTIGNKGDIFSLTVNLQQKSLTWFKNRVSIERGYYTCTDPIIYPLIMIDDGMEVII